MRKKPLLVALMSIVVLMSVVLLVTAQRPEPPPPPPLPDLGTPAAQPGATPTPAPNEQRPYDVGPPTVTSIPFKTVVDLSGSPLPEAEKVVFIVRKENGEYIKVLALPTQLEDLQGRDLHSFLGLSPKDEIVNLIPPESLIRRQIPRPTQ
jgi:hypothetical protein